MNSINQTKFNKVSKAKEINIKEYYDIIKRRFWIVIVITLLFSLAGYIHSIVSKSSPVYQATSRFILDTNAEYLNTLVVLVRDPLVLDKVINKLELKKTSSSLANQISVSKINDSKVIRLTVIDSDPQMAKSIADNTVEIFKEEIAGFLDFTYMRILPNESGQIITIQQNNDRTMLAFILGIVVSIGLIFLVDSLDNSIRSEKDVEEYLGLPVIGTVYKMSKKNIYSKKLETFEPEMRGETVSVKQNLEY